MRSYWREQIHDDNDIHDHNDDYEYDINDGLVMTNIHSRDEEIFDSLHDDNNDIQCQ